MRKIEIEIDPLREFHRRERERERRLERRFNWGEVLIALACVGGVWVLVRLVG